jgi:methionyl aminopeptidase
VIVKRNAAEVDKIKKAGRIVAEVLQILEKEVRPGVTTQDLDRIAEENIRKAGAEPAFKGYQGYPSSICVSINEEVVHGIPSERTLKEADIVGIDIGVRMKGYYADSTKTFPVGAISDEAKRLVKATQKALYAGIEKCRPGNRLSDISHAIQRSAESNGFSVVRKYVGHGIGRMMHEDPQIPNYGSPDQGPELEAGMVFAVEPMLNAGGFDVEVLKDNWTVVTSDRSLSAHFEHTVVLTESDPLIVTRL